MKPILCLDFDGVIHRYDSRWQGADVIPDPPTEGAMRFLWDATDKFRVAIFLVADAPAREKPYQVKPTHWQPLGARPAAPAAETERKT